MKIYRNRILEFESNDKVEHYSIPFDINIRKYKISQVLKDSILLIDESRDNDDFCKKIILHKKPLVKEFAFLNKKIVISLVYENSLFLDVIKILSEEHYISNIPTGLYFILQLEGSVIGVIVMSKLVYTNPVGRKFFFKDKFKTDDEIKKYALNQIGWISRIAIRKPFQSMGIGNFFVSKIPEIIFDVYPNNKLEHLEILTSWTLDKFIKAGIADENETEIKNVIFPIERDFLCKSKLSYKRINLPDKTKYSNRKVKVFTNSGEQQIEKIKVAKYYYVRQLE